MMDRRVSLIIILDTKPAILSRLYDSVDKCTEWVDVQPVMSDGGHDKSRR